MRVKRILLITNVPAAYRLDLYQFLASLPQIVFRVLFTEASNAAIQHCQAMPGGFDFHNLSGKTLYRSPRNLGCELDSFNADTVICAGASPATAVAAKWCSRHHRPLLIWWGGTAHSEAGESFLRKKWRRFIFSRARAFIAYSGDAADYLMTMGIRGDQILTLGNLTFDTRSRVEAMKKRKTAPRGALRLLTVAQLSQRKNIRFLLPVYQELLGSFPNLGLTIVGDGDQLESLKTEVREGGLDGITFTGKLPNEETLKLYANADLYLHPSLLDQWPQVVNEALTAGLPVVASNLSGISDALIVNGRTGWLLPLDKDQWCRTIHDFLKNTELQQQMQKHIFHQLQEYDLEHIAGRLVDFALENINEY